VGDVLVLCYHAVSETWPAALAIEPERLDAQVGALVARGYRGATFTEAVTKRSPGRTLAVTFDDGFHSVLDLAAPILARHGLPATVFVATEHVGPERLLDWPVLDHWVSGPHESELAAMSWDELGHLASTGWEIGSHTCSHPYLPTLDDSALRRELERSKAECSDRLGTPCESLAYPFGAMDRRVVAATRRAGYRAAAALPRHIGRARALCWPRVGVWRTDPPALFDVKASPATRRRLDFETGEVAPRSRVRIRVGA
jgi:peptidoglycan/xylan/chitin deacetylase (PgdA/CDA1 family)